MKKEKKERKKISGNLEGLSEENRRGGEDFS